MFSRPWVPVDNIAIRQGAAGDSFYRCTDQKGLPAHRVGRLGRFKDSEVDKWVRGGGAGAEATPNQHANTCDDEPAGGRMR